jgi:pyridoxamine 5'-phosphate oxidase
LNIADLRREYHRASLTEADVDPDPLRQFQTWLHEAVQAAVPEPTAMTLATVAGDGTPSARIVLLKGVDPGGFIFFTNYESRKGTELDAHPTTALLFHWVELERQIRIEGVAARVSAKESETYFATRPLASRIGAWASPQSRAIPSREWLEQEVAATRQRFASQGESLPPPPHWGGYRVAPRVIEFWQGRASRLHDRLRYQRDGPLWRLERLAP